MTSPGLGQLSLSGSGKKVTFQYNPSVIKFTKSQVTHTKGTINLAQENAVTDVNAFTFNVDDLRMEGKAALEHIKTLFDWLIVEPGPPSPAKTGGSTRPKKGEKAENQRGTPQTLQLTMGTGKGLVSGDGVTSKVILKKVEVNYVRFNSSGDPVRAKVNLTLELNEKPPGGQNPTSHSPAGGRVHVTTAGDNLARIAQSTYADPMAWRDIAAANDIDDPLRVRNGRSLFLPYSRPHGTR